jgi:hypothetical protein
MSFFILRCLAASRYIYLLEVERHAGYRLHLGSRRMLR